ncbi:hypothetical protein B0T26DRAFT_866447 [Lasiosphaeria miniovina]|uniref:G domain-containing protein n=1 Tax=Lasiosphaeria miniovina TaxID=1954250 RepID=A0AA40BF37_9PEZI|nr:uncharacterized protein B0T26DRAFT_866447 [Lasiosphaeria miniovina]KAK0733097.1 hypothetical protein B0T26DRAFT_866447 [Lasiosphaeria miniovina]
MEAGEPQYVVPYSFSYQLKDENDRFRSYDIQRGSSPQEQNGIVGQSATQKTIVYLIPLGDEITLRLVDTPGIGDIRGIEQDALNKEDILATLHHINKLYGILILLKLTNSRLNVIGYSPGDTFNPLKTLLATYRDSEISLFEHNTYCFDSESFRFLRLLKHWSSLNGHKVKSTLSVNTVRDHIIAIADPLAKLTEAIEETIRQNTETARVLKQSNKTRRELESQLRVQVISFDNVDLLKPRMVYSHADCHTSVKDGEKDGEKDETRVIYNASCHDEPSLRACRAFDHGLRRTKDMRIDPEVESLLAENASAAEIQAATLAQIERDIKRREEEKRVLVSASTEFGRYLKRNSIVPYNIEKLP